MKDAVIQDPAHPIADPPSAATRHDRMPAMQRDVTDRSTPAPGSILILIVGLSGLASPTTAWGDGFDRNVRPLLQKHCVGCHGAEKPKGDIDLAKFGDEEALRDQPELWVQVVDALVEKTMPPPGSKKAGPNEDERQRAADSIQAILDAIEGVNDPGPALIQRLTRTQYNNTIRNLLGVETRPADRFPADGGGGGGFDNNASTLFVPPILMEKYLAAAAEVLARADPSVYLVARPGPGLTSEAAARRCLTVFARRAFRRPVNDDEVDRLLRLFRHAIDRGDGFEAAVRLAIRAVLVAPSFLFLIERDRTDIDQQAPYPVSDHELACRLSYFLWSSMPDPALDALADAGRLHEPSVLDGAVRRMLADPKSRALAEEFAGQWLRVGDLGQLAEPDARLFPEFTPELRASMVEEAIAFFHAILREDRPVLDLLDADYTYLNERLAKHYGIDDVSGEEFRRVTLKDRNRGGVLGMASVLTLTSYPRRTSPVLRGKWVLEELLGTPPPPPPPSVKALPADDRVREGMTFRQRLEQHRKKETCAACHARLDPLGFGLENYDVLGRWRDEIGGEPVDARGELTTGETFVGPSELKKILVESKRDLFVRNLVERLLSYALRRGVEYYDGATVKQIIADLESNGQRATVLVASVVRSYPFQYRRNAGQGDRR